MKHTKNMVIKHTVESRELYLFADNNNQIYNWLKNIAKMLAHKVIKGIYDKQKAIDAVYPVTTAAAKAYCKKFGGRYNEIFNVTARYTAAYYLLNDTVQILIDDILNQKN